MGRTLSVTRIGLALVATAIIAVGWSYWRTTPREPVPEVLPDLQIRRTTQPASPTTPADFTIRVSLTTDSVTEATIELDGRCDVFLPGLGKADGQISRWSGAVRATETGFHIGGREIRASQVDLIPEKSPGFWVDGHQYRGRLRLIRRRDRSFFVINLLPLEEYLASVVDSEMPRAFPTAARQAQAVVARTFALYQIQQRRTELFDVYASVASQKYLGFQYRDGDRRLAGESDDSRRIVEQTRGMVCLDRGRLFRTYYSAVCGGSTTSGREVFPDTPLWLTGVACNWCSAADRYHWTATFERGEFFSKTAPLLRPSRNGVTNAVDRRVSWIEPLPLKQLGLIPTFRLMHDGKQTIVSGIDLRSELGTAKLYSPKFSIEPTKTQIHIRGSGHGHGVGLCQWGARGQALEGKSCLQILRHYYPRAEIVAIDPGR